MYSETAKVGIEVNRSVESQMLLEVIAFLRVHGMPPQESLRKARFPVEL
jgi:hypothetical protein